MVHGGLPAKSTSTTRLESSNALVSEGVNSRMLRDVSVSIEKSFEEPWLPL